MGSGSADGSERCFLTQDVDRDCAVMTELRSVFRDSQRRLVMRRMLLQMLLMNQGLGTDRVQQFHFGSFGKSLSAASFSSDVLRRGDGVTMNGGAGGVASQFRSRLVVDVAAVVPSQRRHGRRRRLFVGAGSETTGRAVMSFAVVMMMMLLLNVRMTATAGSPAGAAGAASAHQR